MKGLPVTDLTPSQATSTIEGKNMEFKVRFLLSSSYEDEDFDMKDTIEQNIEANNLDDLFDLMDEVIQELDDSCVINSDTDESPIDVNIEYVRIRDNSGKEVYRDEDYTDN